MSQILIAPFTKLLSHSRFLLSLRSKENVYSSLILFRLSSSTDTKAYNDDGDLIQPSKGTAQSRADSACSAVKATLDAPDSNSPYSQIYVMESACPHLGADMSHAEIEECDTGVVAVCPWHRYDFDLRTGKSDTGLSACTYKVEIKADVADGVDKVYMETPHGGTDWKVVELRPVSEAFADPPPEKNQGPAGVYAWAEARDDEPVVPLIDPPKTLMHWAVLILNTPNPRLKVERTKLAVELFRTGKLSSIGHKSPKAPAPPAVPSREDNWSKNAVDPTKVKNRRNRAAMLHALANIEQWAIDLAWDIMARFGPTNPDLPPAFFADFTKMALDESKHFSLLVSRLNALSPSTPYGSLPVHAGLWESATITAGSLPSRLAIIHLVHEARGLDVNPATIEKFRRAGDKETVGVMETIHADEVTHVTAGHRWFVWACEREQARLEKEAVARGEDPASVKRINPIERFREEVKMGWTGDIKGPFNVEDREKAGLTPEFYSDLKGELGLGEMKAAMGDGRKGAALGGIKRVVEEKAAALQMERELQKVANGIAKMKVEYETAA